MTQPEVSHALVSDVDARRFAPSAARNREPLLAELRRLLPGPARLLEVASGSGEHALWFSTALPHITWQPTDPDPDARASIAAWRAEAGPNMLTPLPLDASAAPWPVEPVDVVLSINMIHIAPWSATAGLMSGAALVLAPAGRLLLYGPYREGAATTEGNAAFDADLRARDSGWGVRELTVVTQEAATVGLRLMEMVRMPAGNLLLVFGMAG